MKPVLYVLGGVVATLAFIGLSWLLAEAMNSVFGIYGLIVEMLVLFSVAGGYTGWLVYRYRRR